MIEKLTKKQEEQLANYRDNYIAIGLSTEQCELEKCIPIVNNIYEKILNKPKVPVVLLRSPVEAWMAVCLLSQNQVQDQVWYQVGNQARDQVLNQVMDQVRDQVWDQVLNQVVNQVEDQVWNQVRDQVENQVRDQVWNQVRNQVGNQVENQVGNQVRNQVGNQVRNQVRNQVGNRVGNQVRNQVENQVRDQVQDQVWEQFKTFIWPYIDGHLWTSYFSFYDYMQEVLALNFNPESKEKYDVWRASTYFGLMYPLKHVCILCDKPQEIHMQNGRLHNPNGPSVLYRDGFSVYSLNGIKVPKEIVETPANDLDPKILLTEKNVEVRREIVRKIGVYRIYRKLGAEILDKKGTYELVSLNLGDERRRPYLKMVNPSIETIHLEGVAPEIKTVEAALVWRNGLEKWEEPIILT